MYSRLPRIIIALECAAIIFLGTRAYRQYNARFVVATAFLSRENLIFPTGDLRYFYEPAPQSIDESRLPAWLPERPSYAINNDSLHERFDYAVLKPDGVYRIVTLGDSFTFGLFVNTQENWVETLEDMLNKNFACPPYKKFEVINLGYMGYDIRYGVERYKRRGEKYNPDLVIWFLKQDDFDDISEWGNARVDEYRKELLQTKPATTASDERDFWEWSRQELLKTFSTEDLTRYHAQTLNSLDAYFKGKLLVYSMNYVFRSSLIDNQQIVENFIQNRPQTYFYLSDTNLKKEGKTFPDNHPDKDGHAFIAQDLFTHLAEAGIIQCGTEKQNIPEYGT